MDRKRGDVTKEPATLGKSVYGSANHELCKSYFIFSVYAPNETPMRLQAQNEKMSITIWGRSLEVHCEVKKA